MDGPSGGRGKWSQAGVPKKGWECVNIEDLGEPSAYCEMCESSQIRFVHYMRNSRFPNELACGVVCAGHMEEDLVGAEIRDKGMKSNARKRKAFPNLKSWGMSGNGNPTLKQGIFRITVFEKRGFWRAVVNTRGSDDPLYTRDRFTSKEDAQRAAFDTLTVAQERAAKARRDNKPWENDM